MSRKFSKELTDAITRSTLSIKELGTSLKKISYSPLCAYVDVCQVNNGLNGVLSCNGTFTECKSFNMEESFGGLPVLEKPSKTILPLEALEEIEDNVNYGGSISFTNTGEQGGVLTPSKVKDMMDKMGDLTPPNSPYYILTPDDIYTLKNPEFKWREPKEMVVEGEEPKKEELKKEKPKREDRQILI